MEEPAAWAASTVIAAVAMTSSATRRARRLAMNWLMRSLRWHVLRDGDHSRGISRDAIQLLAERRLVQRAGVAGADLGARFQAEGHREARSEERRGGKECGSKGRSRGSPYQ